MATSTATKPRKPRVTAAAAKDATVEQDVQEIKQELAKDLAEVEVLVSEEEQALQGKSVQELRDLHAQALEAEANAKRLVHILRQRAANAAVDADTTAEKAVIAAKQDWAKAAQWVRKVENALEGEFKDLYGTIHGR